MPQGFVGMPLQQGFYLTKTVFLMPESYYYQELSSEGSHTILMIKVNSTEPIYALLMNSTQFNIFMSNGKQSYLFASSGVSITGEVSMRLPGSYYLVLISNETSFPAVVTLGYATVPVDVHVLYSSAPAPIGIADYGVANSSGTLLPYEVRAEAVIGQANISSLAAYNPLFLSPYAASLQLNAVLQVNTSSGFQDYLVQNVVEFFTNEKELRLADNIWNITSTYSYMSSSRVSGYGEVATQPWAPPWARAASSVYSYVTANSSYSLPFTITLKTAVFRESTGVEVCFGAALNGNNSTYDRVLIDESTPFNASLVIDGYSMTPVGNYYDAELVFGGGYGGEATQFTSMSSSLSMAYVLVNGSEVRPRSLFGFGSDTAESAYNLVTTCTSGIPHVMIGNPDLSKSFSFLSYPLPQMSVKVEPLSKPQAPPLLEEVMLLILAIAFTAYQVETSGKRGRTDLAT
ncbi:thermopsin [Tardisphaera miroshnichenkoae]